MAALSIEGDLEQQGGDSDGDVMTAGGSGKSSDSEKSDLELSAFLLELRYVTEDV